jgi:hypothetical protein
MLNIHNTIAFLKDAEHVIASKLLTDDEKGILLVTLIAGLPEDGLGTRIEYASIARAAIQRHRQKEGRKTVRSQKQAEVAPQGTTEPAEAEGGTPTGIEEQAEDTGSLPQRGPESDRSTTRETEEA